MTEHDLKSVQKEAKRLANAFNAVAAVKPGNSSFVDDLKKALNRLPDGSEAADATDRIREAGTTIAAAEAASRAKSFGAHEAVFVRSLKDQEVAVRELNSSWRVGPIEIEVQREASQARCCYNHEPVVPWQNVAGADDLRSIHDRGLDTLGKAEIPESDLPDLIVRAFEDSFHHVHGSTNAARRVPIHALLRSIRIERMRKELAAGNPGKALRNHDMPMWALLYNLDRYRDLIARLGTSSRIQFETGSQQEQSQGKSVTLNGLNATQDYQVYAHAVQRG